MTTKKINPAKATPQAARSLRVAQRARAEAPQTPDKMSTDEDDKDPDDDEDDDAKDMAAHDAKADDAAAKHRAAADAAEGAKGTDSASSLMAYESAHDEAMSAGAALKASCASMRGAEPDGGDAPNAPPAAPSPQANARALSAIAPGGSASTHLEIAQWAGFGRSMAAKLKASSIAQAEVLGGEAVAAYAELPKIKAELHARALHDVLAGAVHAGMDRAKAFAVNKDGTLGAPLATWSKMSIDDVRSTVALMGFEPGKPADARAALIIPAADVSDDAGLAARAKASGMSVEQRREAEENQRRSAAQERGRYQENTR